MPYQRYAVILQKLELRRKALAANLQDIRHLADPLAKLEGMLSLLRQLLTEQASLTARRQEVSRRIEDLAINAQKLITFVDVGVREHYGNRSEKLAEYGLQPFRSKPRIRRVGLDGKPVKRKAKDSGEGATASPRRPHAAPSRSLPDTRRPAADSGRLEADACWRPAASSRLHPDTSRYLDDARRHLAEASRRLIDAGRRLTNASRQVIDVSRQTADTRRLVNN